MRWLLDTNVWIHYLKNPQTRVRTRLEEKSPDHIRCCSVVWAELLYGAQKYGVPERRTALIRETLAPYVSLQFDDAAAEHYAAIRHKLEAQGYSIGPNDLLIAAICLTHDCTLVTSNTAEFQRVPDLKLEDWLLT